MKSCVVNNYIQRDGFVMVSNLLISHQQELELTNRELTFIIKVLKHKENYKLHDDRLDPTVSKRTLQRIRKSLTDKGYLKFKVWKHSDELGHIRTEGITYDFSALEERLQQISDDIAREKESQILEEAENYIIEFGEDSPITNFLEAWEEHYGDKYRISPIEKKWYNSLSEEDQECVGRIFDYCEEYRLFKEITPRLSLFMKAKTRWTALKCYCEETPVENFVCDLEIIEEEVKETVETEVKEKKKKQPNPKYIREDLEDARKKLVKAKEEGNNIRIFVLEQFIKDKLEELKSLGEEE